MPKFKRFLLLALFTGALAGLAHSQTSIQSAPAGTSRSGATLEPSMLPYNRLIRSAGREVFFGRPQYENHSLDVLPIPAKNLLVVEHRYGIALFNLSSQKELAEYNFPASGPYSQLMSTYSGIKAFEVDNKLRFVWGTAPGNRSASYVFEADWDGKNLEFAKAFPLKTIAPAGTALPNEIAVLREANEIILYIVENGNNRLTKMRESDGSILWSVPTGTAPFGIAVNGNRVFVSNWGGADATGDSTHERAGVPWGYAFTDPRTGAVDNGSVSVFDQQSGRLVKTIRTGLHPNVLVTTPDRQFVLAANGNSDNVSIIDAKQLVVLDSIASSVQKSPWYKGSSPNGMAISANGKTLYVANGMDNALAVFTLTPGQGRLQHELAGFIPTGAYPSGIALAGPNIIVANLEGRGAWVNSSDVPAGTDPSLPKTSSYNSHHQLASVSFIPVPNEAMLRTYSQKVQAFNMVKTAVNAMLPPRKEVQPVPVPLRIGEPSVFKHVVYIIKENRTYDQVMGDMKEGRGEPALCAFGEDVTPNQHQLARDFLLLDNYYASGKCSAEGHQWTDAAMVTDYIEKSVRAWFRSYPHAQYDAMVYDREGFIWNQALDHHKSVRIYGEACTTQFDNKLDWQAIYQLYQNHEPFACRNVSTISRVRPILSQRYPGYDDPRINDQLRADAFIEELHYYEAQAGDQWPELIVMSLPNDHTTGLAPGFPTPRAMVADNDLALGRIVEAITRSRYWNNTAIFVTEDDSQNGWDHISAYRTTGFVVSPYSALQKTISNNYNQLSVLSTIEHILGLPPMNSLDATAQPMFDCFSAKPQNVTYKTLPNRTSLTEMNRPLSMLHGIDLRYAKLSRKFVQIDGDNDDLFNRVLWYAAYGRAPYPAAGITSRKKMVN